MHASSRDERLPAEPVSTPPGAGRSAGGPPPPAQSPADAVVDLIDVESIEEYGQLLRRLQASTGRSLRALETWGQRNRKPLPRSTVSDILAGRRLPSKVMLRALLEACDVSPAEAMEWERTWSRLAADRTANSDTRGEPPHDVEAERCLLASMLVAPEAIAEATSIVKASDFYRPAHKSIYQAITQLYEQDEPADPATVAAALARSGELESAGSADYLLTLRSSVPTAGNAARYSKTVKERAVQRLLIEAGTRIAQIGYQAADGDADDMIDLAEEAIRELTAQRVGSQRSSVLANLLASALDEIEEMGAGGIQGVPTGFADLDRLLNGLRPGHLIVVAGVPGVGKSTLASDFARSASIKHHLASAIFSMETGKNDIIMRLLAAEARIPLHVLRSGQLSDDDWKKLAARMGTISEAPLFVDDTRIFSRWDLWQEAIRLKRRHDLRLLVVDSPLALRAPDAYEVIRDLKLLARQIECPVVVVSQLQSGHTPGYRPPTLDDLDETLTQIADVIILLHREDLRDVESPRAGEADLIVAKHRNGPTDTVTVAAQVHLARFVDIAVT